MTDPTSPPSHKIDRGMQFRVALIGVIAALAGAAVGGFSSYKVADVNAENNRVLDRLDARQTAYVDMITAANRCQQSIISLSHTKNYPGLTTSSVDVLDSAITDVGQRLAAIQLIGSRSAFLAAIELSNAINKNAGMARQIAQGSAPALPESETGIDDDLAKADNKFAAEAKADLDSE
ncbi:hypothetical protein [uncultured Williamsia sp.]|uniref:hypothetical protein n=1 Tax=uncultured Williamsia sp. TaxID=259311 RepID=UPI002618E4A4|nr:hypothetical protein [uncultured Williamsia sp.]